MKFTNKNVLITGGSAGIGFGLALRFVSASSRVLITGRDQARLEKVKANFPEINIFRNALKIRPNGKDYSAMSPTTSRT